MSRSWLSASTLTAAPSDPPNLLGLVPARTLHPTEELRQIADERQPFERIASFEWVFVVHIGHRRGVSRVVITGAAGAVGVRVAARLAKHDDISAVAGIDLKALPPDTPIESHVGDLGSPDAAEVFAKADAIVHLASSYAPVRDGTVLRDVDTDVTTRTLDLASTSGARRLVVMSSAMVYGAWEDNPVPITEAAELRPNDGFTFAEEKVALERAAADWRTGHPESKVAILRPTAALASGESSWVARTLRASAGLASDHEPPVQFLHLDDLADAVVAAVVQRLDGPFNVAPDGWIDGHEIRQLVGRAPRAPITSTVASRVARASWTNRFAPTPPGIIPYTTHPWVVANDRLRAEGWEPTRSTAEAFVEGNAPRPWAMMNSKRRQQLAIGGATAAAIAAAGAAGSAWRRLR